MENEKMTPEQIEMKNLELNIRRRLSEDYHWKQQRNHWNWVVALAALAIVFNGLAQIYAG